MHFCLLDLEPGGVQELIVDLFVLPYQPNGEVTKNNFKFSKELLAPKDFEANFVKAYLFSGLEKLQSRYLGFVYMRHNQQYAHDGQDMLYGKPLAR